MSALYLVEVLEVQPFTVDRLGDLDILLGSDDVTDRCWCLWFIVRVADFHAAGRDGNRAAFVQMANGSEAPVGLIAYDEGEPVGWCAAGPRERYTRVLRAPTLKHRDRAEDPMVWLVPCFFVRAGFRRGGVAGALLSGAVAVATSTAPRAIEGFPLSGTKARSGGSDFMTGVEPSSLRVASEGSMEGLTPP